MGLRNVNEAEVVRICNLKIGDEFMYWGWKRRVCKIVNGRLYYDTWAERLDRFDRYYMDLSARSKEIILFLKCGNLGL